MHIFDKRDVAESQVAKFYSKLTHKVKEPIYQLHMTIIHQKNLKFSTFTSPTDMKNCQLGPEI